MTNRIGNVGAQLGARRRRRVRFLCAVASVLLVPSFQVVAGAEPSGHRTPTGDSRNWRMFRGNPELTGTAHGSLPDKLKVLWTFETGEPVTATAAIVDGVVYAGADDGTLYALSLADGKPHWNYKANEAIRSSPTVVGGAIYVGDDEGVMHCIDLETGKRRWIFQTEAQINSSPTPAGDRLVFGSYNGLVYCLAAKDGKLIWKYETRGRVHGTPGVSDGRVLVAGCDEFLHVLRLDDGKVEREISMGSVSGASAAIRGPHVFVGTYGGTFLNVNWKAGKIVWQFHDPELEFPFLSSAAVTDDAVFFGGRDKRLRALDPTDGHIRWTFVTKGRIDSSPVVVGNRVFVGSSDGNLYSVDRATGREVWRFEAGAPISASAAVASGRLVIGDEDGVIYCFGPG